MPRATPTFPAFDEWRRMSEREQDKLLDRFERLRRRSRIARRAVMSLAGMAGFATCMLLLVF